ncbi:C-type lectin domain family 4 member G-like [Platysternon megacephalum]|uniref:C-type lectin domain family 4 member G-like n=1 Tax=Platysternon megacephalum TaxID=55544 RepID=A0A4D9DH72_9SAUR|nr:C-type lectin domain family 4 member G-like [Platysternon megacephalum]
MALDSIYQKCEESDRVELKEQEAEMASGRSGSAWLQFPRGLKGAAKSILTLYALHAVSFVLWAVLLAVAIAKYAEMSKELQQRQGPRGSQGSAPGPAAAAPAPKSLPRNRRDGVIGQRRSPPRRPGEAGTSDPRSGPWGCSQPADVPRELGPRKDPGRAWLQQPGPGAPCAAGGEPTPRPRAPNGFSSPGGIT